MRTIHLGRKGLGRKGVSPMLYAAILGLLALVVFLPLGVMIWQNVDRSINSTTGSWSTTAKTSYWTTQTNIGSGFQLLAIVPIVFAAAAIIGVMLAAFMLRKGT